MPRPSNTETRRQQIVEGLMSVMSTSGYGGATIPLIAKAAGLTTGLVHYHFDTKQSILIELVNYLVRLVDERFAEISTDAKSAAHLTNYINANLAYGKGADPVAVACWISIGAEAVNQPEVRLAYQQATKHRLTTLENICEQILRAENRKIQKKREIALGIIAAIEGSYHLLVAAPELIPRGFAAPIVNDMARGLIAAQPVAIAKKRK
jgi:TetR/AcrR family transcriptional regulator, transcriptional repressor of bet genes